MLEKYFKGIAEVVAVPFIRICIFLRIKPNVLSFLGLVVVVYGCYFIYIEEINTGLLILFIGLAIDGLDGPLARSTSQNSEIGAFIDSIIDRIAEMFIWSIFCIKFANSNIEIFLSFFILTGSFLIPYIRAKSESVKLINTVGLTPRPERIIFAIFYMAVTPNIIFLYLFTIFIWITVVQRSVHLYRHLK